MHSLRRMKSSLSKTKGGGNQEPKTGDLTMIIGDHPKLTLNKDHRGTIKEKSKVQIRENDEHQSCSRNDQEVREYHCCFLS